MRRRGHVSLLLAALAAFALPLISCEHAPTSPSGASASNASTQDVVPGEWIIVTRGSKREVLSRQQYVSLRERGIRLRTPGSLQRKPESLLDASTPLALKVGQVRTFVLEDTPVLRMQIFGTTAKVYVTKPYLIHRRERDGSISEHHGADVYIQGLTPGYSRFEIDFSNGASPRQIDLDVSGPIVG